MNKYQKEKSREIRDIMRTDPWRRMSYKEAKRKWKKGIRAIPMMAAIRKGAAERNVEFEYTYLPTYKAYEVRFVKTLPGDGEFEYYQCISNDQLRLYRGDRIDLAEHLMQELDMHLRSMGIITSIKKNDKNAYVKNPISFTGLGRINFDTH